MKNRLTMMVMAAALVVVGLPGVFTLSARATTPAIQQPSEPGAQPAAQTPRKRRSNRKKASGSAQGIPKGVGKCLEALMEMANKDPLPAYEGRPEQIINDGLLWDDPKSRCSVGSDAAQRLKVFNLSKAWRDKDAGKVRSLLDELKSAAPQ